MFIILSCLDMHYNGIGKGIEMPKVGLKDQARASIFTRRTFISSKIVLHVLVAVSTRCGPNHVILAGVLTGVQGDI